MRIVLVGTTSSIHFLSETRDRVWIRSMSSSDAARNMSQSTWSNSLSSIASDWSDNNELSWERVLHVSVSAYKQAGADGSRWSDLPKGGAGEDLYASRKGGVTVSSVRSHACWWWRVESILEAIVLKLALLSPLWQQKLHLGARNSCSLIILYS